MTLHLYFARCFAWWLGLCFVAVLALIGLVDLVEQVRRFSDQDVGPGGLFELVLLNLPQSVNQILPLIVLLATIGFFINMARTSELVATRAVGRSALGVLVAPVAVVIALGAFATSTLNPIVAATSKKYEELSQSYRSGGLSTLSISDEGLWLRQGSEDGQIVIRALQTNADASKLFDVTFLSFDKDGEPYRRIRAQSANLEVGAWLLTDVKDWPLARRTNAEANASLHDTLRLPSDLTAERIRESFGHPSTISIWQLRPYISGLDAAGFSSRQHEVWLQSELARPLFLVAMVLIASGFTMRHARFGGTGLAVLAAILLGFSLYFIRSFALILGENGQLPILLAAWAPPVASVLLACGPLLHAEDG
ncbi:MAG: LPS export ABC transporter permease LptG [Pseudomonadota bacterium]